MTSVLDRAKAHYGAAELREIDVPEWGDESGPLVLGYRRATLRELADASQAADGNMVMTNAYIVAMKALGKDGKRLFNTADARELARTADPTVITRIAAAMAPGAGAVTAETLDDAEKN